jgi:hypothetical protein
MKKISLLLGVLFFSFFIGCKSIDESVQPDTAKSKQGKTMRLQGIPEGNGQTTFAMGGISGECQQHIFNDPNQNGLAGRQGLLAVRAITWTEGFMQNKFNINDRPVFLSEPYRSYELMLATAVASKEGWEDGGDLDWSDRVFIGLRPMKRIVAPVCDNNSFGQEELLYYEKVVSRGWNLWYDNQQMSFEQLADLVELEIQKDEFTQKGREETILNLSEVDSNPFGNWEPYTSSAFLVDGVNNDVREDIGRKFSGYSSQERENQFTSRLGRILEDAVARSLQIPLNSTSSPQFKIATSYGNFIPDMLAATSYSIDEIRGGKTSETFYWWEEGAFLDSKAVFNQSQQVPFDNQARGFIDWLSRNERAKFSNSFFGKLFYSGSSIRKKASENGQAILSYITHHGVTINDNLLQTAGSSNVLVLQHEVEYDRTQGKIRVTLPVQKNQQYMRKSLGIRRGDKFGGIPVSINWNIQ